MDAKSTAKKLRSIGASKRQYSSVSIIERLIEEYAADFIDQQAARIVELEKNLFYADYTIGKLNSGAELQMIMEAHNAALIRAEKAEAERDAAKARHMRRVDHVIDLSRIIEALCHGHEIPVPVSDARHHFEMAVAHRATAYRAAWCAGRDAAASACETAIRQHTATHGPSGPNWNISALLDATGTAIRALTPPEDKS